MAQTTGHLHSYYLVLYEEGEVEHINSVWQVFPFTAFYNIIMHSPDVKQNPTINSAPWPFV